MYVCDRKEGRERAKHTLVYTRYTYNWLSEADKTNPQRVSESSDGQREGRERATLKHGKGIALGGG